VRPSDAVAAVRGVSSVAEPDRGLLGREEGAHLQNVMIFHTSMNCTSSLLGTSMNRYGPLDA
jgi:hypothetical protein